MKTPFKFLDSYKAEDKDFFFGRQKEIEELYYKVFDSRLMLVYGCSGSGKSSLVNCGLASKFDEKDWLPIIIRRKQNIIESTAMAIIEHSITSYPKHNNNPEILKNAVKSLYLDYYKPIYFIFDQFEELFIFGSKDERFGFVQILKALIESEIQCRIILIMREEYIAEISEFEEVIPDIFSNRIRLERMSKINTIRVIEGLCNSASIKIQDGFAESLFDKLSFGNPYIELTYLQIAIDKLYNQVNKITSPIVFTNDLIEKLGNVADLLGTFLDEQIKQLKDPEIGITILKSLVSIKGTKKQLTLSEIFYSTKTFGKDVSESSVLEYIQKFVDLRILSEKDADDKYELRHDTLASKILEKISIPEKEIIEVRLFLENSYLSFKTRNILLNQKDLKYVSHYEDKLFLSREILIFIEKSKIEQRRTQKRILNIALLGFVAVLIFALGAIMMAYQIRYANIVKALGLIFYSIGFLPIFIFYIKKSEERSLINLLFLVFTFMFIGNTFLYDTGIRKEIQAPNAFAAHNYQNLLTKLSNENAQLYYSRDSLTYAYPAKDDKWLSSEKFGAIKERSDEIYFFIEKIKYDLVSTIEGSSSSAINGNQINHDKIKRINEKSITTKIMLDSSLQNSYASDLKSILNEYKEYLNYTVEGSVLIKNFSESFLNTDDIQINGKTIKWEDYNFKNLSLGFVMLNLTKIQVDVRYVESRAISYVSQKGIPDL